MRFSFYLSLVIVVGVSARRQQSCRRSDASHAYLWRLRRDPPVYFFGTIHVPYTEVLDSISPDVLEAFRLAGNVIFELDLSDQNTLKVLAQCRKLPQSARLIHRLPPSLYQRLKNHMRYVRKKLPDWLYSEDYERNELLADSLLKYTIAGWERQRPIWVAQMLNQLTPSKVKQFGVQVLDSYLAVEASRLEKRVGAIEDAREQCQALNSLNSSQEIFVLNQTLNRQEWLRRRRAGVDTTTRDLIHNYNCGSLNMDSFNRDAVQVPDYPGQDESSRQRAQSIFHHFRHQLIHLRNQRMAARVISVLAQHPQHSFFFAFGAGHFLGPNSVVDLVRNNGYIIEPVFKENHRRRRKKKKRKPWNWMMKAGSMRWLKADWVRLGRRLDSGPRTSTARPQIRDLWIRMEDFSGRPWEEMDLVSPAPPSLALQFRRQSPNSAVRRWSHSPVFLFCIGSFILRLLLG